MPQTIDPNFARTVVLLCWYNGSGAFGLIVNRPLVTSGTVVVEVRSEASEGVRNTRETSDRELELWVGGPVEPQRSWILVGDGKNADDERRGNRIADGLYLSTSPDLLHRVLGRSPPPRTRLIVGCSGWGAGQLEAELQASAWLISDIDHELIFCTPANQMWEAAIRRLGADPAALQVSRGVH